MTTAKRTPLYDLHLAKQAKVIDFHGWEMPVQYQSIVQEHQSVRRDVGVFDVSHMGEFLVTGSDSKQFVQYLVTNDVERLADGQALYTLLTDDNGGIIDDLLVYRLAEERWLLVVNAGNIDVDYAWVTSHTGEFAVKVDNISDDVALIALQGPRAQALLAQNTDVALDELRPFTFAKGEVVGQPALVSRTGYTGEDGFELYVRANDAAAIYEALIQLGAVPCGLGARDTLRLEAKLPLYGNELSREVTPYEAGLGMFVKLDKGDFIGRAALVRQKEVGVSKKLVGIQTEDRAIPRTGYKVFVGDEEVGVVTSGTMSPTLQVPIGLVLVDARYAALDQMVDVEIRGRRHPARVVKTPFYKRNRG
ncbi:glycine cleavage system aminomethyltransferase GcvT [Alicyclobacillus fastidiosus]|uniref:Aminomethyltransferase n=1 Tax=Alicyclobacillus fastidiosus TaxID=392011 RepID=A0ABY6ZMW0_9BACL|nr:glycine cleavage system aminomethyltransferase GcvT [Alicyclobacillus fastidiosus]WAH44280.1 glycine cleavage system aminomethyltransferase GcvT [Alicyclobacillus fastidiosus]GMA60603.1 aminomethyltransferase [Alicyclobacillus fastidiosus]